MSTGFQRRTAVLRNGHGRHLRSNRCCSTVSAMLNEWLFQGQPFRDMATTGSVDFGGKGLHITFALKRELFIVTAMSKHEHHSMGTGFKG